MLRTKSFWVSSRVDCLRSGARQGIELSKTEWSEHGARGWECVRDVVAGISSTGLPCG
jgi:hypothetical protein